jgi:hypothetical protein
MAKPRIFSFYEPSKKEKRHQKLIIYKGILRFTGEFHEGKRIPRKQRLKTVKRRYKQRRK